ncbi:phosphodiester glycosidase family protein [Flavonifractor sp. An82]|uniref:phosphodiester glycosidase family protein n=1 Tax=Flavonifractor sp. An82 TaxID=1965660 RepID=UPI00111E4F17|nr:phosphodiester glycosidase family protein [Flavonifractor sp. An82]
MKRRLLSLLAVLALMVSLIPGALAAPEALVITMRLNSPWCVIGDTVTQIDSESSAVVLMSESGRTMLPIRRMIEAYGGTVEWVPETNGVRCSLNGTSVELEYDSTTALVNGEEVTMDVPMRAKNNRSFVPVRFVSENLGLYVEWEPQNQIVVVSNGQLDKNTLTALPQVQKLVEKTTPKASPVTLTSKSYALASGTVSANVITVNMKDPRVSVKSTLSNGKLNSPASFQSMAASSGAVAVINANFFNSNSAVQDPIGHLMVNGQFVYASSGISSLGITDTNEMRYGRPPVFVRIETVDGGAYRWWDAYEVNMLKQFSGQAVLYTPARGTSFQVTYPGSVLTVINNVTTSFQMVSAGQTVSIPANGYVLYSSDTVTNYSFFNQFEAGRTVALRPYLQRDDVEGFQLDGVQTIVSGAPRLVQDGVKSTYLDPGFTEARFTTAVTPRTAVGTTSDGKLLLVNVKAATIEQMRDLMLTLGCVDAINLDGGASTAMYYNGQVLSAPGRNLTSTLQVFVSE